jgi:hypothetical protein
MNQNENDFEALTRLLALKRHETPPPGYFEGFADQVTARIRTGDAVEHGGFAERLAAEAPWLVNFLGLFQAKPAFVGAFASALCLLLLLGIVLTDRPDAVPAGSPLMSQVTADASQAEATTTTAATTASPASPLLLAENTNSSLQPVGAPLFGSQNAFFQSASYAVPGN